MSTTAVETHSKSGISTTPAVFKYTETSYDFPGEIANRLGRLCQRQRPLAPTIFNE